MLNWIGRIVLLAVGALMIGFSIYPLIQVIQNLNGIGWNPTAENASIYYTALALNAVTILAGLPALLAGLTGKGGFWLFLISVILIAGIVVLIVMRVRAGATVDVSFVLETVKGFAFPIAYIAGSVLVMVAKPPKRA